MTILEVLSIWSNEDDS